MAFTTAEKAKIAHYMGWPSAEDTSLARGIQSVESVPDRETLVRAELTRLTAIDASLDQTATTARATQAGSLQLRVHYEIAALRTRGRQTVARIAAALAISPAVDVFSGGKPAGLARDIYP